MSSMLTYLLLLTLTIVNIKAMAATDKPVYKEMKVELELDDEGGLPESIGVTLPVADGKFVSLDLIQKEDQMKDVKVIVGGEDGESEWTPHHGEKFHVYSDLHYFATFSVALNQSENTSKLSLYGSYHHDGHVFSVRPDDEDFDRAALELEALQEFFVTFRGHQHLVTEDKPVDRNHLMSRDFIRPDEL